MGLHAVVDAHLHVRDPGLNAIVTLVHALGVISQGLRRAVDHLQDALGASVAGRWACCPAVEAALELGQLEGAVDPFLAQLLAGVVGHQSGDHLLVFGCRDLRLVWIEIDEITRPIACCFPLPIFCVGHFM